MSEGEAINAFYIDCTPEVAAWAEAQLKPQSQSVLGYETTEASWRSHLSTNILTTEDQAVPPDLQRMFAAQADDVGEFDSSQSPFLSRPDDLAALLLDVASRA